MFEKLMEHNVDPLLIDLAKQFMRKTKRNLYVKTEKSFFIKFYDPLCPGDNLVGVLTRLIDDNEYRIHSRLIKNNRYKEWRREHRQQETKDPKKALKIMCDSFLPFSPHEISSRTVSRINGVVDEWVKESRHAHHSIFAGVDSSILLEEVRHMQAMGYAFKTAKFQKMAEEGLEAHREYELRKHTKFFRHHVYVRPDKAVQVHTYKNDSETYDVMLYPTEEQLPEHIKIQMGMLRIVGPSDTKGVHEVGVCLSDNEFWVLEKVDTSSV